MFSKKPESTDRPSGSGAMSGTTFSVLGPDIVIKGDLAATADLHLDGRIEGDVKCAALIQGEAGEVAGVVIAESARIEGDVAYGTLTIEEGAQVDGKFTRRAAEAEPKLMLAGGTAAN